MDKELLKAVYEFEIKGNFAEAEDMLSKISLEGDAAEKSEAFFLLGKIQELSASPQNAAFYYRQALANPKSAGMAYFLASRIAALDSSPERLVERPIRLRSPVERSFPGESPAVLLSNGALYRLPSDDSPLEKLPLPEGSKVQAVSPAGIWYTDGDGRTLRFQTRDLNLPSRSIDLHSEILHVVPISNTAAAAMTQNGLSLVGGDGVRLSLENRYRGCKIVGTYSPTESLVLNCEDNALHFIRMDTGSEEQILSLPSPILKTFLTDDGVFVLTSSSIRHYKPQSGPSIIWKREGLSIEAAAMFGPGLAVLESDGTLRLWNLSTGRETERATVDGETLFEISAGALGVFSGEGALTVLDSALNPLWHYHFGRPLAAAPVKSGSKIHLPFDKGEILPMTALHFGKKPLLSETFAEKASAFQSAGEWDSAKVYIDSALALEAGNPTATYLFAVNLERIGASETARADAWARAVRFSSGDKKAASGILAHFAKIVGASYARILPLSPHTLYPNLFGAGHRLYTVDPAAQKLFSFEAETGNLRWTRELGELETSPILSNDASHLAFASGFRANILELSPNGKTLHADLPGKPFQLQFADGALFVSTWNGYFVKLLPPGYRIAWARKLFDMPFLIDFSKSSISAVSLEGSFGFVNPVTGQNAEAFSQTGQNVVSAELSDSLLAIATDKNEIRIYDKRGKLHSTLSASSSVLFLKWVSLGANDYLLAGFSDQKINLYSPATREPIWTYPGKGSVYMTPVVRGNSLYIDQHTHIAKISLSKGTVEFRYPTPGGAGTPFILGNTLFCTSPKRLLYAFPLSNNEVLHERKSE